MSYQSANECHREPILCVTVDESGIKTESQVLMIAYADVMMLNKRASRVNTPALPFISITGSLLKGPLTNDWDGCFVSSALQLWVTAAGSPGT